MSQILLVTLGLWNLLVFLAYSLDKWKAVHQRWRISERSLLAMSIFAGGLGAFLAGRLFRHKTRKWYFSLAWILGILIDCLLIYLILRYLA